MNLKSNICLLSNVYNRVKKDIRDDQQFAKNVSGVEALKILEDKLSGTLTKVRLSHVQKMELKMGLSCSRAKNGESTHGKVLENGIVRWVCKCEYTDCEGFSQCSAHPDFRPIVREEIVSGFNTLASKEFSEFSISYDEFHYSPNEASSETEQSKDDLDILEEDFVTGQEFEEQEGENLEEKEFAKIEDSGLIINADIHSNILVNAGPGTGKTYTVINRLLYIIKTGFVNPKDVLVICNSNYTVAEILKGVEDGILERRLHYNANQLNICTFDSFVAKCLSGIAEFTELSYNRRINLFNKTFSPEWFKGIEYLIIDELQDIVNARGQMVLNIIKNVNCGLLLLGDRCQAIYDYDCGEEYSMNSNRFYNELNTLLSDNTERFELIKNKRQSDDLARFNTDIRDALLHFDIKSQNEFVADSKESIKKHSTTAGGFKPKLKKGKRIAVLSRRNGEAERISSNFHQNNIPHTLLRGNRCIDKLHRWIADVFWDFREEYISRADFIERFVERTKRDEAEGEKIFSSLSAIDGQDQNTVKMEHLASFLIENPILPKELVNEHCDSFTVSTVHCAKGREFDEVFLVDNEIEISDTNSEVSRLNYVAFTRPKQKLSILKKNKFWHFKRLDSSRYIGISKSRRGYKFCSNITIGFDGDVDNLSFVSHKLFKENYQVIDNQLYIAENIEINDPVEIYYEPVNERYVIDHNGRSIGLLSDNMIKEFWEAVRATQVTNSIPPRLTGVYVNNIISVVNSKFDNSLPLWFRESRIWLGVELTGFSKIIWPE